MNDINLNEGITFGKDGSITGGTSEKWTPMGKMNQIEITSQSEWDSKVAEYKRLYTEWGYSEAYSSSTKTYYYAESSFKGKIDGQYYTIEGMYAEGGVAGLIGVSDGATVQNLIWWRCRRINRTK